MKSMEKIKLLEHAICSMMNNNTYLVNSLLSCLNPKNIEINISNAKTSRCILTSGYYSLDIGIGDIEGLYDFCKKYFSQYINIEQFKPNCVLTSTNESGKLSLIFREDNCSPLPSEQLSETKFLDGGNDLIYDILTLYAFAYAVYHEIGHIVRDSQFITQLEKENSADMFAFEVVGCPEREIVDNHLSLKHLGLFLGVAYLLQIRSLEEEIEDKEHPLGIKRLFALLDFWKLKDESFYWKMSCEIICAWCKSNNVPLNSDNSSKSSPRDTFENIYNQIMQVVDM